MWMKFKQDNQWRTKNANGPATAVEEGFCHFFFPLDLVNQPENLYTTAHISSVWVASLAAGATQLDELLFVKFYQEKIFYKGLSTQSETAVWVPPLQASSRLINEVAREVKSYLGGHRLSPTPLLQLHELLLLCPDLWGCIHLQSLQRRSPLGPL